MKLNKLTYNGKKIACLCVLIEQKTGLTLRTNLEEEFDVLIFTNDYSYIKIDYLHKACFTLMYSPSKEVREYIEDIMITLRFMQTVGDYQDKIAKMK